MQIHLTKWRVVIRFQICIFDILNTACNSRSVNYMSCDSLSNLYLWHIKYSQGTFDTHWPCVVIRFQICIFDILNTACNSRSVNYMSCDSLSNLYLWHIKYSQGTFDTHWPCVVIRFQICIFDILNTAHINHKAYWNWLWFAFKFVSLTY